MSIVWLLDAGHGGMYMGGYQTSGKRSPVWEDGSQLLEGEFNRAVCWRIAELCDREGLPYVYLYHEHEDVPLEFRVKGYNMFPKSVLLSVHANAGGGKGWEVWTSKGETRSDKIATVFFEEARKEFSELGDDHFRTDTRDGDVDKESNFYILRHTVMPAILTENFFMDNPIECQKYLLTPSGRDRIAKLHFQAMLRVIREDI